MSTAAPIISTPSQRDTTVNEISVIRDIAGFRKLEHQWNTLVTASNNSLFQRHEFLRVWYESFAAR